MIDDTFSWLVLKPTDNLDSEFETPTFLDPQRPKENKENNT